MGSNLRLAHGLDVAVGKLPCLLIVSFGQALEAKPRVHVPPAPEPFQNGRKIRCAKLEGERQERFAENSCREAPVVNKGSTLRVRVAYERSRSVVVSSSISSCNSTTVKGPVCVSLRRLGRVARNRSHALLWMYSMRWADRALSVGTRPDTQALPP